MSSNQDDAHNDLQDDSTVIETAAQTGRKMFWLGLYDQKSETLQQHIAMNN